jgi:hypothetical protein
VLGGRGQQNRGAEASSRGGLAPVVSSRDLAQKRGRGIVSARPSSIVETKEGPQSSNDERRYVGDYLSQHQKPHESV